MKTNNKLVLFLAFVGVFLLGISFLILTPKKANADSLSIDDIYDYEYISCQVYLDNPVNWNARLTCEIELELYYFTQGTELYLTISPNVNLRVVDALYNDTEYYYYISLPVINGNNEFTISTDYADYTDIDNNLSCELGWNFSSTYNGGGIPNNIINFSLKISAFGETKTFNNTLTNVRDEDGGLILNYIETDYIISRYIIPLDELNSYIVYNNFDYDVNETFEIGSFLVNSVGAFFDFEIAPGLSISSIFMIIISGAILAFIIKIFFGG